MDKQGTQRPAGPEPQVDAFREACRLANLKVTHQREVIFREMVTAEDHPCVEALYERVRKKIPAVSRDTVYRTLAMLEEAGFVTRVPLSGAARFDGDVAPHHHFHCKGCGAVFD
ncbi:MAG: Fur family transcriptional regulator, partial [Oceanidesulfovibrio sp.]